MKNNRVAIIPARGGSKRIPKKNIIDVCGKPMITYTIEAAKKSKCFDEIVVSTDDPAIARISKDHGASVPFFRDEFCDDKSSVSQATIHTLEILQKTKSYCTVVQLMANCPLRDFKDIKKSLHYFENNSHNFQISATKFGWLNPWWAHMVNEKFEAQPLFNRKILVARSQDQPELYCPTGAIWIADVKKLREYSTFYGANYRFFPLHWKNSVDIDNFEDLELVKLIMRTKTNLKSGNNKF